MLNSFSRDRAVLVAIAVVFAGCGPTNPCPVGVYDPGPPRMCRLPDGGAIGLDDAGLHTDGSDACVLATYYQDRDGDGYGDPAVAMEACQAPAGWASAGGDCDDGCAECFPGGAEVCEGRQDEDCLGGVDDGCDCVAGARRACPGGSEVGACAAGEQICSADGSWSSCVGAVTPVAETCDGVDNDCDGVADGATAAASCAPGSAVRESACSAGECRVIECTANRADCDVVFDNGCEADLESPETCGACSTSCGWRCDTGACNDIEEIVAGNQHSCARGADGSVLCWGANRSGQVGDGSSGSPVARRLLPVAVLTADRVTPLLGVRQLSAGGLHSCAIRSDRSVVCWGANGSGQLGDGTASTLRNVAAPTVAFGGATQISLGDLSACAVDVGGRVRCWGSNAGGQLGDGTTTDRNVPTLISIAGVGRQVAVGAGHACVVLTSGVVQCWGQNSFGQLGDGTTIDRTAPVAVTGLSGVDVVAIAAGGNNTCALSADGRLRCWGFNLYGSVGDGGSVDRLRPVLLPLTGVSSVSVGDGAHACAITLAGESHCWGLNAAGMLGTGTMVDEHSPTVVSGAGPWAAVSAGFTHTCALSTGGGPYCWGNNASGERGDGTTARVLVPTLVSAP